jgi:hypothetical protein
MYGNRLLIQLWIDGGFILGTSEKLERVHHILDQEVISKIRSFERRYGGRLKKAVLKMDGGSDETI